MPEKSSKEIFENSISNFSKQKDETITKLISITKKLFERNKILIRYPNGLSVSKKAVKEEMNDLKISTDEAATLISDIVMFQTFPLDDELLPEFGKNKKIVKLNKQIREIGLYDLIQSRLERGNNPFIDIGHEFVTRHFVVHEEEIDMKLLEVMFEYYSQQNGEVKEITLEFDSFQLNYLIENLQKLVNKFD